MAEWSRRSLRVPAEQVWYIPNFVDFPQSAVSPNDLPGNPGARIVCVANFRPQKDHAGLVRAMVRVVLKFPQAHLLLVGAYSDNSCARSVRRMIVELGLSRSVSILGARNDVPALLRACDVAVLGSASEGLPLALLEYGAAGLPSVATRVGQCAEVLDEGRAGKLVAPSDPERLAEELNFFLHSAEERRDFGERLRRHVERRYSAGAVIDEVCSVYESVLLRK
jgi:glycosyltransferase involved in cell wall biosynthesis